MSHVEAIRSIVKNIYWTIVVVSSDSGWEPRLEHSKRLVMTLPGDEELQTLLRNIH